VGGDQALDDLEGAQHTDHRSPRPSTGGVSQLGDDGLHFGPGGRRLMERLWKVTRMSAALIGIVRLRR